MNSGSARMRTRAIGLSLVSGVLASLAGRHPLVSLVATEPALIGSSHSLLAREVVGVWTLVTLSFFFNALLACIARGAVVRVAAAVTIAGLATASGQFAAHLLNSSGIVAQFQKIGVTSESAPHVDRLGISLCSMALICGACSSWLAFRTAAAWSGFSRRYDRQAAAGVGHEHIDKQGDGEADSQSLWRALDAGIDPTVVPPSGPANH